MWNKAWVRVNSINVSYFSSETKLDLFSFFLIYIEIKKCKNVLVGNEIERNI